MTASSTGVGGSTPDPTVSPAPPGNLYADLVRLMRRVDEEAKHARMRATTLTSGDCARANYELARTLGTLSLIGDLVEQLVLRYGPQVTVDQVAESLQQVPPTPTGARASSPPAAAPADSQPVAEDPFPGAAPPGKK